MKRFRPASIAADGPEFSFYRVERNVLTTGRPGAQPCRCSGGRSPSPGSPKRSAGSTRCSRGSGARPTSSSRRSPGIRAGQFAASANLLVGAASQSQGHRDGHKQNTFHFYYFLYVVSQFQLDGFGTDDSSGGIHPSGHHCTCSEMDVYHTVAKCCSQMYPAASIVALSVVWPQR